MKWDCLGIQGTRPVFVVADGDFAAVVSEEPMRKYRLVRDFLMAHQLVNERVMQTHRLLPVKFATLAEDQDRIIEEVLRAKVGEFEEGFTRIAGKEEVGLRVRWKDLDGVYREIGANDEKIRHKKEWISSLPEEARRMALIDIGHLVQEAARAKNEAVGRALMDALSPLAAERKQNKTLGDAMILNAAFLVEKEKREAFDGKVEVLEMKYGDALHFKYLGPIPPFNFVEIAIRWQRDPGQALEDVAHVSPG
ncbi:MAG: GvpL/GvpF family gas vesicle protein [Nitrospirae bacterium]|nr:GvpL/GvpF family gas vesicle protein [Nitrospirota bacterium]